MKRHDPDWISAAFGLTFSAIAVTLLVGNLDWSRIDAPAIWAVLGIVLGAILVGSAVQRTLAGEADPTGDQETFTAD